MDLLNQTNAPLLPFIQNNAWRITHSATTRIFQSFAFVATLIIAPYIKTKTNEGIKENMCKPQIRCPINLSLSNRLLHRDNKK